MEKKTIDFKPYYMNYLYIILFILSIYSCSSNQKTKSHFTDLSFLSEHDTLLLGYINNKCGEWGGDVYKIQIFKSVKNEKTQFYLNISEKKMDCNTIDYGKNSNLLAFEKKNIPLNSTMRKKISTIIEDFIRKKMNSKKHLNVSNSNKSAILKSSDGELNIRMTNYNWKLFFKLFKELKY